MKTAAALAFLTMLLTACQAAGPAARATATPTSGDRQEALLTIERLQAENAGLRAALDAKTTDLTNPAAADITNSELQAELEKQHRRNADLQAENQQLELLAGLTAKGELVETERARFGAVYDPQRDVTTVASRMVEADGPRVVSTTVYALGVAFEHPGQELARADRPVGNFDLTLETDGNPTRRFAHIDQAILTIDGDRHSISLAAYTELSRNRPAIMPGQRRAGRDSGTVDERLTFALSRLLMQTLARANEATLTMPNFRLKLNRTHFALARAALTRSE